MGETTILLIALGSIAVLITLALLTFIALRVDAMARAKQAPPLHKRQHRSYEQSPVSDSFMTVEELPRMRNDLPLVIDEEEMFNPTLKGPHR